MTAANCSSSSSSHLSFPYLSCPGFPDSDTLNPVLNMSPMPSGSTDSVASFSSNHIHRNPLYKDNTARPEEVPSSDASLSWDSKDTMGSFVSTPVYDSVTPKSSDELRKEIATLESEILHLERYLLSLYRTAFDDHLKTLSDAPGKHLKYSTDSPLQAAKQLHHKLQVDVQRGAFFDHDQNFLESDSARSDNQSCISSICSTSIRDEKKGDSGRRSLADHLGTACFVNDNNTSDKLSEDVVRCISSIYCRLANPSHGHVVLSASPASSLSSSSIFSSQNPCNNCSPHREDDARPQKFQELKEESGPYNEMVEILKICLDDRSFNYAEVMLKNFRLLVRCLEKVDPTKMKREEKLAFWINIHNALVMHAYLAYGTGDRIRVASILKAAYNVGGHCINACTIQNSILGIRSHYAEPWLQTLISPGRRYKTGRSIRHVYALEYPEPLVHFALCSGTRSDPPVRVYTAKNIFQELKHSKEEFIQSTVRIHKETKIFLPKILSYFAKDMSLDIPGLLEIVIGCLTQERQKSMRKCMGRKFDRYIHWLPQSSSFRYIIHGELAKRREIA